MSTKFINFLVFFIALTSIGISTPALEIASEQVATIQSLDNWDIGSLSAPSQKFVEAYSVIAQDFIPIVLISDHSQPLPLFDHYLPLYKLQRAKEYFLLI